MSDDEFPPIDLNEAVRHEREQRRPIESFTILAPDYYEDDEVCGYCKRKPGDKHEVWCRQ